MESTAATPEAKSQVNVYSLITDKIIEQLEKGNVPWQKPWGKEGPPTLVGKKPYYGINALLLGMEEYENNTFLSFDQVHGFGGKVKRGSKGYAVVYWKNSAATEGQAETKGQLKYYTVFNIGQCENIGEKYLPVKEEIAFLTCQQIIEGMPNCPKIDYTEPSASYDAVEDVIHMPKKRGKMDAKYYATIFRQLVHSTGHDTRLFRKGLVEMSEISNEPLFSKEDLVAEIGTFFLLSLTGIVPTYKNSPAYIQGWLSKFKQDKLLIFLAAKEAQTAVNYILNVKNMKDAEQNDE